MKINGLMLLATSHNVTKAYLSAMLEMNLIPERIIYLEFMPAADLEPQSLPRKAAKKVIGLARASKRLFESRSTLPTAPTAFQDRDCEILFREQEKELYRLVIEAARKWGLPAGDFFKETREILDENNLRYETMKVSSLNDESFIDFISRAPQSFALYVDGGILRKHVLSTHMKFIHVHPGLVPHVRGSECLLWGGLINRKVGVSCFFMNEKIDGGDILLTKEYPLRQIHVPHPYMNPEFAFTRYVALLEYLDPCYRADVLSSLLRLECQPKKWRTIHQDLSKGRTYYYLHSLIRDKAVNLFFTDIKRYA